MNKIAQKVETWTQSRSNYVDAPLKHQRDMTHSNRVCTVFELFYEIQCQKNPSEDSLGYYGESMASIFCQTVEAFRCIKGELNRVISFHANFIESRGCTISLLPRI